MIDVGFPIKVSPSGLRMVVIRLRGAGAAAPTVEMGPKGEPAVAGANVGVTMGRAGVGSYTLAFSPEKPGKFAGGLPAHSHDAPTATTHRHCQLDANSLAGTSNTLAFLTVTPATDAAAAAASDLTASDTLCLFLFFKQTGPGV